MFVKIKRYFAIFLTVLIASLGSLFSTSSQARHVKSKNSYTKVRSIKENGEKSLRKRQKQEARRRKALLKRSRKLAKLKLKKKRKLLKLQRKYLRRLAKIRRKSSGNILLRQQIAEQERIAAAQRQQEERTRQLAIQQQRAEQERIEAVQRQQEENAHQQRTEQEKAKESRKSFITFLGKAIVDAFREKEVEKSKITTLSLEKERIARTEEERLEKERIARVEEERLEKERIAKAEEERLEKERIARAEEERLEKERIARVEEERLEKERVARVEEERLEKERIAKAEEEQKELLEKEHFEKTEKGEAEVKIPEAPPAPNLTSSKKAGPMEADVTPPPAPAAPGTAGYVKPETKLEPRESRNSDEQEIKTVNVKKTVDTKPPVSEDLREALLQLQSSLKNIPEAAEDMNDEGQEFPGVSDNWDDADLFEPDFSWGRGKNIDEEGEEKPPAVKRTAKELSEESLAKRIRFTEKRAESLASSGSFLEQIKGGLKLKSTSSKEPKKPLKQAESDLTATLLNSANTLIAKLKFLNPDRFDEKENKGHDKGKARVKSPSSNKGKEPVGKRKLPLRRKTKIDEWGDDGWDD